MVHMHTLCQKIVQEVYQVWNKVLYFTSCILRLLCVYVARRAAQSTVMLKVDKRGKEELGLFFSNSHLPDLHGVSVCNIRYLIYIVTTNVLNL